MWFDHIFLGKKMFTHVFISPLQLAMARSLGSKVQTYRANDQALSQQGRNTPSDRTAPRAMVLKMWALQCTPYNRCPLGTDLKTCFPQFPR